jgi:HEAT repeat protein
MSYVPPPPGSTKLGEPTPEGVAKQNVHIADLPAEVRRSFLLSMVFFPTIVGATVCLILFLGYYAVFKPKNPFQYSVELSSTDARRRWMAARELSENIGKPSIYESKTLTVLIEILQNAELDKETAAWTPSAAIKDADEKESRIRWWAAPMVGLFAAKLPDQADKDRGLQALLKALEDKDVAFFAAKGLGLLKDPRAREALAKHLASDKDPGVRIVLAHALAETGYYAQSNGGKPADVEIYRAPLREAFLDTSEKDSDVLDNLALALARLGDATGKERIEGITKSDDAVARQAARAALEMLGAPAKPELTAEAK